MIVESRLCRVLVQVWSLLHTMKAGSKVLRFKITTNKSILLSFYLLICTQEAVVNSILTVFCKLETISWKIWEAFLETVSPAGDDNSVWT